MKNIKWTKEKRKISELKEADYNPRMMTEAQQRELEESIDEYGAVIPLVVNTGKRDNILIGGHQRRRIYEQKGIKEVDVMVPSRQLTKEEEKKLNLRLNKNTGQWDPSKIKEIEIITLLEVGFDDEDLQIFFDDVEMIDDDFLSGNPKKVIDAPKSRPGDVYQLGSHRLMCGDSTDPNQVAKLMQDELADVVHSDPPKIKKDKKYAETMIDSIEVAEEYSKPNSHIFYWTEDNKIKTIQQLYQENKIRSQSVCMWVNNKTINQPKMAFSRVYQPCVYGVKGKPYLNKAYNGISQALNKGIGLGGQGLDEILEIINIWIVKRDIDQEYKHPDQKPVTLAEKPLKRCTAPGHIILDLFGGSGSMIIAAEQINRQVRMMEIDPVFCDTIIKRWEEFTNKKAKKI